MTQPLVQPNQLNIAGLEAELDLANISGDIDLSTQVGSSVLPIANGGTGETTQNDALNALLPAQTGNAGEFLTTDGTNASWAAVSGTGTVTSVDIDSPGGTLNISGSPITTAGTIDIDVDEAALDLAALGGDLDLTTQVGTSILPVANGGTGLATLTANNVVLGNGTSPPSFVAPSTTGNVLTSNGTTWTSAAPAGGGSVYYKDPVRVATTANGTLATAYENGDALDGVTLVTGDRILLKNQTTASENGIYTVNASGAPTRATDFDTTGAEVSNGVIIPVQFGTVNGGSCWQLVQNGGTIGNNFRFSPVGGIAAYGPAAWTTSPLATGANSIAIGQRITVSGAGSLGINLGTSATTVSTANAINIGGAGAVTAANDILIGINGATGSTGANVRIGRYDLSYDLGTENVLIGFRGGITTNSSTSQCVAVGQRTQLANSITGAVAIGSNSRAAHSGAIAFGSNALTDFVGQLTISTGNFAANGDVGVGMYPGWVTTTNATPTEVGMGAAATATSPAGRIALTNDSSYIFDCDIVARNTATDAESAMYNLKFGIRRGTNAASTTLVGTPVVTVIGEDTGTTTWDVSVTADTTNGRPNISVTGEAAKTIRWVANIRMTKVSG